MARAAAALPNKGRLPPRAPQEHRGLRLEVFVVRVWGYIEFRVLEFRVSGVEFRI